MARCVTAPLAAKRQAENNHWLCGDRGLRHFKGKRDVNVHKLSLCAHTLSLQTLKAMQLMSGKFTREEEQGARDKAVSPHKTLPHGRG